MLNNSDKYGKNEDITKQLDAQKRGSLEHVTENTYTCTQLNLKNRIVHRRGKN